MAKYLLLLFLMIVRMSLNFGQSSFSIGATTYDNGLLSTKVEGINSYSLFGKFNKQKNEKLSFNCGFLYLNDNFLGSGYSDNESFSNNIFNEPNLGYYGVFVGSDYKIVKDLYLGINAGVGFSTLKTRGEYFVFDHFQDIRLSTISFKEDFNSKIMFNTNVNLGYKFSIGNSVFLDVFIQGTKWFGGKRKRESIVGNNLEQIPAKIHDPYLTRFEDLNINPEFIMGGIALGYHFH